MFFLKLYEPHKLIQMKNNYIVFISFLILLSPRLFSQSITFPDDQSQRGYYNRPYQRYEAEDGKCRSNGVFLEPTYNQTFVQSEASNQSALQLTGEGDFVEWDIDEKATGLTIRFSLPDTNDGKGTKGTFALYADNEYIQDITLDSYWAWQYFLKSGDKYPDNTPADNKFPRMRFDEMHFTLEKTLEKNSVFKLVKKDENTSPYTIDFIELELIPDAVTFKSIEDENKVIYTDTSVKLSRFILNNEGKTIFLPPGRYDVDERIFMNNDNTKLIGAGMWYTEIYFSASSDVRPTHNKRGIEANGSNIVIEGLYINTVNNKRYWNNDSSFQVGKGFMGGFGSNSVIRNVWVEHFECGAWIANYAGRGAQNLLVEHCRFRNNYADGINLCHGTKNGTVQYCSFRNNGDDDMASWSTGEMCENNTFGYNTAENNWRASSLGFFGGKQNKAHHCVIIDPMEAGIRVNCDFGGTGFSTDGYSEFSDISIYKGGVASGAVGVGGDLWGNQQGAVHIHSSSQYDLINFRIVDIDIYNSKNDAVYIGSGSKKITDLMLKNINIDGTGRYGIYYSQTKGIGRYCNITFDNIGNANTNNLPTAFNFTENCHYVSVPTDNNIYQPKAVVQNGIICISGFKDSSVSVFDISGRERYKTGVCSDLVEIDSLDPGIYFVRLDNMPFTTKVFVNKSL